MDSTTNVLTTLKTVKQMLEDRGVKTQNLNTISLAELDILIKNNNDHIFQIFVNNSLRIIYYLSTKSPKLTTIETFISKLNNTDEIKEIILITKDKLNMIINNWDVQMFSIKELLFNVTKHELVPKHELISDESKINELVEKYNLKSKLQFPIIVKTDPIAKYFNIKSGQLMKITRISPSAGEVIVYRCCV